MPAYKVIAEFVDLTAGGKRRRPGETIEVDDTARVQALLRAGVIAAQPMATVGEAGPELVHPPTDAAEAEAGEEAATQRGRGRRGR